MKHIICYWYGLCLILFGAVGQEIQITNIQKKGEEIHVSYNLVDERIDRSYSIRLYTSQDNFIRPVEKVKGDVGVDILVGPNKKIVWSAKDELGDDFSSSLQLELKGQLYVPFIQLDGITEGMTVKRATANDLVWAGGRGDNILQIELYQGEKLVKSFDEFPNTGQATISIPSNVKPGTGYRYRISDSKNRDEVVYSESFTIKRKIPLIPKILAIAAIGIGGYILVDSLIPENIPDIGGPPLPPTE